MPKLITLLSGLLCLLDPWSGATASEPERIDTRAFVASSQVKNVKIAPDGEHVALTYEDGSQVKLAVIHLDSRKPTSQFAFGENMHVLNFWWGSNARVVMAVGEVTGNLDNYGRATEYYAANADGSRRYQIFDAQNSAYQVLHPLPEDDRHILIARYHWADQGVPKGNLLDLFSGELRFVGDQPVDDDMVALIADNDGQLRGAAALKMGDTLDERELRLYVKHDQEWQTLDIDASRPSPAVSFLGFSADNRQVFFRSNHDMPSGDRQGVFRYDLDTKQVELLYRHPDVDVAGLLRGPSGAVVGATARFGPMTYTFFEDKLEQAPTDISVLRSLIASFPDADVTIPSTSSDGSKAIVYVRGDRNPGEFYVLEVEAMQLGLLAAALPDLPTEILAPMKPVRINARDGMELHGYLTTPNNVDKDLPLIVNVHGGPFGVADQWGFNAEAQLFAHHGFATLQVNFRGSGGRGEDFVRAGWREWGGKMQDDVTDATRWAIEQGIADPDRICIYGGSYGGYAALMGVIREPDLYQCAVGYVGVYDLPWFRSGDGNDASRHRDRESRASFERFMSTAVGDDMERLRRNSPVHNVDQIQADLLLVHGGNDVRVVIGHFERLRQALDEIGKDYEWMVKEEEGHGFYDVGNRVDFYDRMLAFFKRHIDPRAVQTGTE